MARLGAVETFCGMGGGVGERAGDHVGVVGTELVSGRSGVL